MGGGYPCCCVKNSTSSSHSPSHSQSSPSSPSNPSGSTDSSIDIISQPCNVCNNGIAPGLYKATFNGLLKNTTGLSNGVVGPAFYGGSIPSSFTTLLNYGTCFTYHGNAIVADCQSVSSTHNIINELDLIGPVNIGGTNYLRLRWVMGPDTFFAGFINSWLHDWLWPIPVTWDCCHDTITMVASTVGFSDLVYDGGGCNDGHGNIYMPIDFRNSTVTLVPLGCP